MLASDLRAAAGLQDVLLMFHLRSLYLIFKTNFNKLPRVHEILIAVFGASCIFDETGDFLVFGLTALTVSKHRGVSAQYQTVLQTLKLKNNRQNNSTVNRE